MKRLATKAGDSYIINVLMLNGGAVLLSDLRRVSVLSGRSRSFAQHTVARLQAAGRVAREEDAYIPPTGGHPIPRIHLVDDHPDNDLSNPAGDW